MVSEMLPVSVIDNKLIFYSVTLQRGGQDYRAKREN